MREPSPFDIPPLSPPSSSNNEQELPLNSRNALHEQNLMLDKEVKERLASKIEEISSKEVPKSNDYLEHRLQDFVKAAIDSLGYDSDRVIISTPAKVSEARDSILALNVISLAKSTGQDISLIANAIADAINTQQNGISAFSTGPFVNISIDYTLAAPIVLGEVETHAGNYGHARDSEPEIVLIDYSSPNVAKNMTAAHLRSTMIGQSLMNLQEAIGNIPFSINHIGDWGTQFGGIIYQYNKESSSRGSDFFVELNQAPVDTLMRLYRDFESEKSENPDVDQTAQSLFLELERGDPQLTELWKQFREWSLDEFQKVYARFGIEFDAIQGESFYEDRMMPAIEDAIQRGVLRINSEGAVVFPSQPITNYRTNSVNEQIMLDEQGNARDEIIVKPSGGSVYLTRDLAALQYRSQELGADKILYVIGKEQQSHCMLLFSMAEQLGYVDGYNSEHVSFGHIQIDGRKMKSRAGKVVLLKDLLDETTDQAESMMKTRKEWASEDNYWQLSIGEKEIAHRIAVGSMIFNDLRHDRRKDTEFRPDVGKNIKAGGAAYIQYTDARLESILKRADYSELPPLTTIPDISSEEKAVLNQIVRLPGVIKLAADQSAPHKLATYMTELCQSINVFYKSHQILKAESEEAKIFRLHLIRAAQQTIGNAANILHVPLPGKM